MQQSESVVILHNIRSAHNVGSLFRTADAAGVSHIYLTGYTPAPVDRFGRTQREIAKTALGAETSMAWTRGHIADILTRLRGDGFLIVAVEQDARAVPYTQLRPTGPTAFIFGNEVRGISKQVRDKSDVIVEIPMCGTKESLNVSVAAGIVLFGVGCAAT